MKKFYITTPLYYPSGKLHIGHTYSTVLADAVARYKRERGYDVCFVTGTDEHGQKMAEAAEKAGLSPQEFADLMVEEIKKLWERLGITYDKFRRTTAEEHVSRVQKMVEKLIEKGDIYKGEYEGNYCVPDEAFWTDAQLTPEGRCPDCGGEVVKRKEEAYFFKLSKYQKQLEQLFEDNPDILKPHYRINEMMNNFIKPGLEDVALTRSNFSWGIPFPGDDKHVLYVWFDALSGYLTALGIPDADITDTSSDAAYWPADVHVIAKEIVRFHTIIWFSWLMALELPLPKRVHAHGWILFDGKKIGKRSNSNINPFELADKYGIEALRYFLLSEFENDKDGQYTEEILMQRINSDLANDFGNLVSRSISMVEKYFGGVIPAPGEATAFDEDLLGKAKSCLAKVDAYMDDVNTKAALGEIWELIRRANKYIDETMPWALAKTEDPKLKAVLYHLMDVLRIVATLIRPFMPLTSAEVARRLGIALGDLDTAAELGKITPGSKVEKGENLFPRIDIKAELEK